MLLANKKVITHMHIYLVYTRHFTIDIANNLNVITDISYV